MHYLFLLVLLLMFVSICLGHNILRFESSEILRLETLPTCANILGIPFPRIVLYLASDIIEE